MQAKVYNLAGDELESIELDDAIFGITPNMAIVHQAVLRQQANARQGTHNTKTRAHVSGGGAKPWRQKGTGRARQGSNRSPQWRHGGVVFGPHTRSYEQDMPRKMRRLAIRSVLSSKAQDGHVVVIDGFNDLEPRTKAMVEALTNLKIGKESALILTSQAEDNLLKAANNLPNVTTQSAHVLSIVDMLRSTYLVLPRASVDMITGLLSNTGGRRKLALRGSSAENGSASASAAVATPAEPAEPAARRSTKAAQTAKVEETQAAPKATAKRAAKPAQAVTISNVQYSGDEYVEIKNDGQSPVDLSGWAIRDQNDTNQAFTFPQDTQLKAGATLQVYTKPGNTYSFNSKRPIWNDKGDALELLDADGKVVSTYAYGSYAESTESEG